jgi:glutathione S-transferase
VAHEVVRVPYRTSGREIVERVSGQRVVPLLVLDGEPICDSHRIVEHLRWRSGSRSRSADGS